MYDFVGAVIRVIDHQGLLTAIISSDKRYLPIFQLTSIRNNS